MEQHIEALEAELETIRRIIDQLAGAIRVRRAGEPVHVPGKRPIGIKQAHLDLARLRGEHRGLRTALGYARTHHSLEG